jgi:hypothetical protein
LFAIVGVKSEAEAGEEMFQIPGLLFLPFYTEEHPDHPPLFSSKMAKDGVTAWPSIGSRELSNRPLLGRLMTQTPSVVRSPSHLIGKISFQTLTDYE